MSIRQILLAGIGGLSLALLSSVSARADVISATYNQPLSSTPVSISFDGVGSLLFTTVTTGYGPGAWVATSGTGQVTTAFGSVTDFFAGASIDQTGELYTFAGYSSPQMIPYSATDDFIGLRLTLPDGIHYGYAEVDGPSLVSVGFQSTAGATIDAGDTGTSSAGLVLSSGSPIPTPEPASIALLASGLVMMCTRFFGTGRRTD